MNGKTYVENLISIKRSEKNLSSLIATSLQDKIRIGEKLKQAQAFAIELNVSNAMISKFLKLMDVSWPVLQYVHNDFVDANDVEKKSISKNIKIISSLITNARKIMFIGVSTSLYTNKDFALKLTRINKWTIIGESKYEQIGLARLLTPSDVLIVNSISLQHDWMRKIAMESTANVVIISANKKTVTKINPTCFVDLSSSKYDTTATRTYTTKARINGMKIYDEIYETLISDPANANLLKLTAYN